MNTIQLQAKYVALLRGINVGGHHKVPMADLQKLLKAHGFANVVTLLNSGNVIFESAETQISALEKVIAEMLDKHFGFSIPLLLRNAEDILFIRNADPFKGIEVTKDTRLYVSFIKREPASSLMLPWISKDNSFRILDCANKAVFSVLDLSVTQTVKGMETLEQLFGKDITTRNWNTVVKIAELL
jgi:uncharacterized protein (DUF1697 family)